MTRPRDRPRSPFTSDLGRASTHARLWSIGPDLRPRLCVRPALCVVVISGGTVNSMRTLLLTVLLLGGSAGAVTLTEAQRINIWKELSAADAKAAWVADAIYPEGCSASMAQINKHAALSNRLAEQYAQVVVKKRKLTRKQLLDLLWEGAKKHWPEAAYPPPSC